MEACNITSSPPDCPDSDYREDLVNCDICIPLEDQKQPDECVLELVHTFDKLCNVSSNASVGSDHIRATDYYSHHHGTTYYNGHDGQPRIEMEQLHENRFNRLQSPLTNYRSFSLNSQYWKLSNKMQKVKNAGLKKMAIDTILPRNTSKEPSMEPQQVHSHNHNVSKEIGVNQISYTEDPSIPQHNSDERTLKSEKREKSKSQRDLSIVKNISGSGKEVEKKSSHHSAPKMSVNVSSGPSASQSQQSREVGNKIESNPSSTQKQEGNDNLVFSGESEEEEFEDEEEAFEDEDEGVTAVPPPPTPSLAPEGSDPWQQNLCKFNKMVLSQTQSPEEVSYVYDLRGLHSEPALEKDAAERMNTDKLKRRMTKLQRHCTSMNDLLMKNAPYPNLVLEPKKKDVEYLVSRKMRNNWKETFNDERKRFSFFDEIMAQGCILDSLEVPGRRSMPEYLVEADNSLLRRNVKYGRLSFKTKNMYTGALENWYFQGYGIYKWVHGATYEGDFVKGVMHGEGKLTWLDGAVYEGQFENGVRSGWGVYSNAEGRTYAGDWKNGLPEGRGKMWYDPLKNDCDFYDGEWKNGLPNGKGTRVYPNRDRYMGDWKEGLRFGKGNMVWLEQQQIYKGEWKDGIADGEGEHIWFNNNSREPESRNLYVGGFTNGLWEGKGKVLFQYATDWVEGEWHKGMRDKEIKLKMEDLIHK